MFDVTGDLINILMEVCGVKSKSRPKCRTDANVRRIGTNLHLPDTQIQTAHGAIDEEVLVHQLLP